MRKNLPAPLNFRVKKSEKGTSKDEKNTRIPQEFLWKPDFRIFVSLADAVHEQFSERVADRRWHFMPCLGLSELFADLLWIDQFEATQLASGVQQVNSVVSLDTSELDSATAYVDGLALHKVRMPRDVTTDRVFSHANYLVERNAKPFPVNTANAWQVGEDKVVFL